MKRAALTIAAVLAAWTMTAATVRTATETFVTNRIAIAMQSATDYTDSAIAFEAGAATNYTDSVAGQVRAAIPTNNAQLANGAGYVTAAITNGLLKTETDPTVPAWAKSATQPLPPNYSNVSNKAFNAVQKTGDTMSGNLKFVGGDGQAIGVEVEYHGADDVSTVYTGDSIFHTIGSSSTYQYWFPNKTGTLALTSDIPAVDLTDATNYTDSATNAIPKFSEKDVVKVYYKDGGNYPSYVDGRGELWELGDDLELGGHWVVTGGPESSQGTYTYAGHNNEWGNYGWTLPGTENIYIIYNPNSGNIIHNGSTATNPPERGKNPEVIGTTFPTCYNIWTPGRTITYYPMEYQYVSKGRFALSNELSNVYTKGQMDAALSNKLDKSGGTVTGELTVNSNIEAKNGWIGSISRYGSVFLSANTIQLYDDDNTQSAPDGYIRIPLVDATMAVLDDIASYFEVGKTYETNSLCSHDGKLYRCVNPNGHTGVWVAADFAVATVEDVLAALRAGKADKSDVEPLLFAQYYPDGSVKSAAEFTSGIKYNAPDTTNRTITVKPFCATGTATNDNSNLSGRVVIPPFVDASGSGYIFDDGTRFKVVGVSGGDRAGDYNEILTAIVAPNTVTTIGTFVFDHCAELASVSLPAVTNIGTGVFSSCGLLSSVSIPSAMDIGAGAFASCSLTSVSLPAATTIGTGAFFNCVELTTIDFGDTPRPSVPTLGSSAFDGIPSTCTIIVPYTQYDAWKAASGWSALQQEFVRHAEKADKPATFTTGNLAKFDANGNPTDSGKSPSDFLEGITIFDYDAVTWQAVIAAYDKQGMVYVRVPVAGSTGSYRYGSLTYLLDRREDESDPPKTDAKAEFLYYRTINKSGSSSSNFEDEAWIYTIVEHPDNTTTTNGWRTEKRPVLNAFPDWAKNTAYTLDSVVMRNNILYRCTVAHTSGSTWDGSKWAATTFSKIIADCLRYSLVTTTITNNAVALDDRAYNYVDGSSLVASDKLTLNLPAGTGGKSRDFVLALECGATPPTIAYNTSATIMAEDASALDPEEGMNIYSFTEFKPNVYLVSRKLVDAVVVNTP